MHQCANFLRFNSGAFNLRTKHFAQNLEDFGLFRTNASRTKKFLKISQTQQYSPSLYLVLAHINQDRGMGPQAALYE